MLQPKMKKKLAKPDIIKGNLPRSCKTQSSPSYEKRHMHKLPQLDINTRDNK